MEFNFIKKYKMLEEEIEKLKHENEKLKKDCIKIEREKDSHHYVIRDRLLSDLTGLKEKFEVSQEQNKKLQERNKKLQEYEAGKHYDFILSGGIIIRCFGKVVKKNLNEKGSEFEPIEKE